LAWCERSQELRGTSERIAMFEAKLDGMAKVEGQDHPSSAYPRRSVTISVELSEPGQYSHFVDIVAYLYAQRARCRTPSRNKGLDCLSES
jgi:hypothetical protein